MSSPSGGPLLAKPVMVLRVDAAALSSPVANSPEEGPLFPSERIDLAPPTRVVGPSPLVPRQEPMDLSKRVLNTISETRAPFTRCLYILKWSVFSD